MSHGAIGWAFANAASCLPYMLTRSPLAGALTILLFLTFNGALLGLRAWRVQGLISADRQRAAVPQVQDEPEQVTA